MYTGLIKSTTVGVASAQSLRTALELVTLDVDVTYDHVISIILGVDGELSAASTCQEPS